MFEKTPAEQVVAEFVDEIARSAGFRLTLLPSLRPSDPQQLHMNLVGPDAPMLLQGNGELLDALEHLASKVVRRRYPDVALVSFDVNDASPRGNWAFLQAALNPNEPASTELTFPHTKN